MTASFEFTVIKTVNIVLCAYVRLDFPFHIAQKVRKLLRVGPGF